MAIYTGHGDMGETSLVTGRRVKKNDPRVEAYGDVDELISYLAVLRCNVPPAFSDTLRRIQSNLMNVAAWLACDSELPKMKPLDAHEVKFLESEIDWMTESLPQLSCFTLPSPPISSAGCNFARTICRRCERRVVAIEEKTDQDSLSIIYLNRLSDYLFTLARYLCVTAGAVEDKWIP